jgi:sporulation protein YlmC with PRC-barrel domain
MSRACAPCATTCASRGKSFPARCRDSSGTRTTVFAGDFTKRTKRTALAALLAPALALPAGALYAAGTPDKKESLYRDTWSAEEMIGTQVRGEKGDQIGEVKDIIVERDGTISKVVVEVGGFFEIADQHIGVPWKDVRIGPEMRSIQVPLHEAQRGTYSLYGRIPRGEDVAAAPSAWRVNELIGDYASLEDVPRYGIVTDVIFNDQGKAQAVIVDRADGTWGGYGAYAYPYPRGGYDPRADEFPLPYTMAQLARYGRFDYVRLGELSRFSSERSSRAERQQAQSKRQQPTSAATGK